MCLTTRPFTVHSLMVFSALRAVCYHLTLMGVPGVQPRALVDTVSAAAASLPGSGERTACGAPPVGEDLSRLVTRSVGSEAPPGSTVAGELFLFLQTTWDSVPVPPRQGDCPPQGLVRRAENVVKAPHSTQELAHTRGQPAAPSVASQRTQSTPRKSCLRGPR